MIHCKQGKTHAPSGIAQPHNEADIAHPHNEARVSMMGNIILVEINNEGCAQRKGHLRTSPFPYILVAHGTTPDTYPPPPLTFPPPPHPTPRGRVRVSRSRPRITGGRWADITHAAVGIKVRPAAGLLGTSPATIHTPVQPPASTATTHSDTHTRTHSGLICGVRPQDDGSE